MLSFRVTETDWKTRQSPADGGVYFSARLLKDVTGAEIIRVHYPAGSITPPHTHPCAHALIVLSGTLFTQDGMFGSGDVVWYPEGSIGSHGATGDGPVFALIVSNKPFAVDYLIDYK